MRLLAVSSWFPYPPDNGSRLRIFHLLEALAREHEVTLLTFGRDEGREQVGPLQRFCGAVHVVPAAAPTRLGLSGLLSPVPRYYAQTLSPEMLARITAEAPSHDVAMGMSIRAAFHVVHASPAMPVLFEEVEVGAAMVPEAGAAAAPPWRRARHRLTWWKHRRFLRHLLGAVQGATVASAIERELVAGLGVDAAKIAVVPNAVVLPERPADPARRRRQVIYPGSVLYSANLDAVSYFVRDVWPGLRRQCPDLRFVVTGETAGVDVAALAAVEGVHFTGRLDDVNEAIAASLACVVPLRVGGGTRLKVLQAMAVGTPVVATSKGVEGLAVEADRHVLVGDTPEVFIAHTLRLVREAALGERLATAARELVRETYTWDRSAGVLMAHLRQVAASSGARRVSPGAP